MLADDPTGTPTPLPHRQISFPADEVSRIGLAIYELAQHLEGRYRELQKIVQITARVNAGLYLDEILEGVYRDFKDFIPYDRIGFSIINDDGQYVRARWAKAEYQPLLISRGFSAQLEGSTLQMILETGQPRIINDLEEYAKNKPDSLSTELMVQEGIRSSLTCPLIANGTPIGFMFFSSRKRNTYASAHVDIFLQIAGQLSVMVEKGRLMAELAAQKQELEQKNEELRRLNEMKNSFVGVAAHDLRNPVGAVLMAVSLLTQPDFEIETDERNYMLEQIQDQAQYMLGLLNDLLDVSHIESGSFTLNPIPFALVPFLHDVAQYHNRLAEVKGSAVRLTAQHEGQVFADPIRLRQVLDNLLSNAVKFSPPGSHTQLLAELTDAGDWLIEVRDEGPGLTAEDQKRLFRDFVRGSAKPTGGERSTGLGLAITRRVIEAHQGKIGVDSEPGHGATFWFTLKQGA